MPPRTVSHDLKAHIPVLRYELGYSAKEICSVLSIKKSLVYCTLQYHQMHGLVYNPDTQAGCRTRRRHLTTVDLSFIRALLTQRHTVYLDEIRDELCIHRGVTVSISTLAHALRRLHFTNKDVSGRALERNDLDRAIYMNKIADLVPDPEMLMFGDEASKDERTSIRRKGWSIRGCRCIQQKCFVRGRRFSILPILTLDGIIAHDIIEGSVTTERFVEFLRELMVSTHTFS